MNNRLGEKNYSHMCDTCGATGIETTCTERCIISIRYNKEIPLHVYQCDKCIKEGLSLLEDDEKQVQSDKTSRAPDLYYPAEIKSN